MAIANHYLFIIMVTVWYFITANAYSFNNQSLSTQHLSANQTPEASTFINIIDRTGNPKFFQGFDQYGNQKFNPLFDLGAWHGFLLPKEKSSYGSFTGPLIIAQEYSVFIAESLEQLSLKDTNSQKTYEFKQAKATLYSQPGALMQRYEFEQIDVTLSLHFVSNRSALVRTNIINKTNKPLQLTLTWQGKLLTNFSRTNTFISAISQ